MSAEELQMHPPPDHKPWKALAARKRFAAERHEAAAAEFRRQADELEAAEAFVSDDDVEQVAS
jgi:hypothetical protein